MWYIHGLQYDTYSIHLWKIRNEAIPHSNIVGLHDSKKHTPIVVKLFTYIESSLISVTYQLEIVTNM